MRWDSPFALATAGTVAIHLALVFVGDAVVASRPSRQPVPAPHLALVEVEVPPVLQPPPPPPPSAPAAPVEPVRQAHRAPPPPVRVPPPPPPIDVPEPPPAEPPPAVPAPSGGAEVVHVDEVAAAATGVAVAVGEPTAGRIGRGGSGGGTGASAGSGAAGAVVAATLKTRARPKRDYGNYELGRNYPADALARGIEGDIRIKLAIDEHGKVVSRALLNRLGHGLDEIAMQRAADIEFTPATDTDNHPVSSVIVWTFHMALPD